MKRRLAMIVALAAIATSGQVLAHHSFSAEFDADKPVKLSGVVTKIEWANPHIWFFMDVKQPDGSVANWGFEMSSPTSLARRGWRRDSMKIGDGLTVEASRAHDGSNHANARSVSVTATGQRLFGNNPGAAD